MPLRTNTTGRLTNHQQYVLLTMLGNHGRLDGDHRSATIRALRDRGLITSQDEYQDADRAKVHTAAAASLHKSIKMLTATAAALVEKSTANHSQTMRGNLLHVINELNARIADLDRYSRKRWVLTDSGRTLARSLRDDGAIEAVVSIDP